MLRARALSLRLAFPAARRAPERPLYARLEAAPSVIHHLAIVGRLAHVATTARDTWGQIVRGLACAFRGEPFGEKSLSL